MITGKQIRTFELDYEVIIKNSKKLKRKPKWTRTEYIAYRVNAIIQGVR